MDFNGYKPIRTEIGKTVHKPELAKRLVYELQLPTRFEDRIVNAYIKVVEDALYHGEGINLGTVIVKTQKHKTDIHMSGFSVGKLRDLMYKFTATPTDKGKASLLELTQQYRDVQTTNPKEI